MIQGRSKYYDQWITKNMVSYTLDGCNWDWVDGGRQFTGNCDKESKVRNNFSNAVIAKTIRIYPTGWINWISLRFEAIIQ